MKSNFLASMSRAHILTRPASTPSQAHRRFILGIARDAQHEPDIEKRISILRAARLFAQSRTRQLEARYA